MNENAQADRQKIKISDYKAEKHLIDEIHSLLDKPNESLAPILRRTIRLSNLCNKDDYRILFESHLFGLKGEIRDLLVRPAAILNEVELGIDN